jgi:prepilin-type processing-associated H-X9-DG protein
MLTRSWLCFASTALLCAGIQACSGESGNPENTAPDEELRVTLDEQAAAELNLLARLVVDAELVVEFYEPAPGVLITSEYGLAGHTSLAQRLPGTHLEDLRPSDYYAIFGAGRELPASLKDAEARLDPRPNTAELLAAHVKPITFDAGIHDTGENTVEKAHGGRCNVGWFDTAFCDDLSWDFEWCHLNRTSNAGGWCTSVAWFDGAVCTDVGNVTWNLQAGDGDGGSWSVLQGHYRTYHKTCGSAFIEFCDEFKVTSNVANVGGSDRYHHTGHCNFD